MLPHPHPPPGVDVLSPLPTLDNTISPYSSLQPNRRRSRSLSYTDDDPLSKALLPPANESEEERLARLQRESEAKKISDDIDEQIKLEKAALKRRRGQVRVLLLGQSESGKSTTLKQFQLLHSPETFSLERIAWRSVIYLNLIRSIKRILDALQFAQERLVYDERGNMLNGDPYALQLSDRTRYRFERYRQKLEPLTKLEERLFLQLSNPDQDEATRTEMPLSTFHTSEPSFSSSSPQTSSGVELAVRPTSNWKKNLSLMGSKLNGKRPKGDYTGEIQGWWENPDDPVHTLSSLAQGEFGMINLWRDEQVRRVLRDRRVKPEESSGL